MIIRGFSNQGTDFSKVFRCNNRCNTFPIQKHLSCNSPVNRQCTRFGSGMNLVTSKCTPVYIALRSVKIYAATNDEAVFFSIRAFFHGHWQHTGQQGKGGDHLLFHSSTFTRSWTFRHLFVTVHVR